MKKCRITSTGKLGASIMALLIAVYISPLCISHADVGESSGTGSFPEVSGVSSNVVQYNRTDITPVAEMERVRAGEPALFRYRNMTVLMNCTRECNVVFTADPEVTPKTMSLDIDPNQTMMLTMNMYRSPLQGEKVMERTLNFYLGLEPNATLQLTAQIRLHINQTQYNQEQNRVINASRLTWMYWNRTRLEWVQVPSYMDQNGYLVCTTNHFSTWTVVEIAPTENSSWGWTIYAIIGAIVIAIIVVAFVIVRRK